MRQIIIAVLLMFTSSVFAMNQIEQQIKASPETSKRCVKKIAYYESKVTKYKAIPRNKRRPADKIKLAHYIVELENWVGYCTPDENGDSQ